MKSSTCCFTGHRKLPKEKIEHIVKRLNDEVESLIAQGVTNFISGGALGFDQIAASLIIAKRDSGTDVRLIMTLPCRDQDKLWSAEQQKAYHNLLAAANETIYVSEDYYDGCTAKRNRYMVDHSAYCLCALLNTRSGTGQTVRYAEERELWVLNVAQSS